MSAAIPVTLGGIYFAKKSDADEYLRRMLNSYNPGERVSDTDALVLSDALRHHPNSIEKIGDGIAYFMVRSADFGTKCFWVTQVDGSTLKFSYKSCLYG